MVGEKKFQHNPKHILTTLWFIADIKQITFNKIKASGPQDVLFSLCFFVVERGYLVDGGLMKSNSHTNSVCKCNRAETYFWVSRMIHTNLTTSLFGWFKALEQYPKHSIFAVYSCATHLGFHGSCHVRVWTLPLLNWSCLVGGVNPPEKYVRQIGSFPQIGMTTKKQHIWNHHTTSFVRALRSPAFIYSWYLRPTTWNLSNHHLVMVDYSIPKNNWVVFFHPLYTLLLMDKILHHQSWWLSHYL